MTKVLFIILITTFFTACTQKNQIDFSNKNALEAKTVLYTKKADLTVDEKHEVIIWLTYLNVLELKQLDKNKESFIISTYFTRENQDLNTKKFELTLNKNKYLKVEKIDKNHFLYKKLSTKSPWGNEYLVTFKKQSIEVRDLKLKFKYKSKTIGINFLR